MPNKRYTPEEIIKLLRLMEIEIGQGKTTAQACKSLGFSEQTYYRWRKKYGGLQINQARKLKELEWDLLRSCSTWHAIIRCEYRMRPYTEY